MSKKVTKTTEVKEAVEVKATKKAPAKKTASKKPAKVTTKAVVETKEESVLKSADEVKKVDATLQEANEPCEDLWTAPCDEEAYVPKLQSEPKPTKKEGFFTRMFNKIFG